MFEKLEIWTGHIYVFLAGIVAISIGLMAALIPLNLLMVKYDIGTISWLYESIEYALYFGVFLGAPWVLRLGAHVRVDVLLAALPKSMAARMEQIMDFAGILLCLTLFYYGMRAAISEFEMGTMPDRDLRIANWIILGTYSLSFILLAMEFVFRVRHAQEIVAQRDTGAGL